MVAFDLIQRKVVVPFELKAKQRVRTARSFSKLPVQNYLPIAPTLGMLSIVLPRIENRYTHRWNLTSISGNQRQVVLQGCSH
jgi:hypothetical protein